MTTREDVDTRGDQQISPQTKRLWELTYHCLAKFGLHVMFKHTGPNVPQRMDEYIHFFVDENSPNAVACHDFLVRELEAEQREAKELEDDFYFPACHTKVSLFSGMTGYLERDIVDEVTANAVERFTNMLSERNAQINRSSFHVVGDGDKSKAFDGE